MTNGIGQHILTAVWAKATMAPGYDMNVYRKDTCSALIAWGEYGNRDSQYGWEVDHIVPVTGGGSDQLSNLRPLHWKNNARKSDGSLECAVRG